MAEVIPTGNRGAAGINDNGSDFDRGAVSSMQEPVSAEPLH